MHRLISPCKREHQPRVWLQQCRAWLQQSSTSCAGPHPLFQCSGLKDRLKNLMYFSRSTHKAKEAVVSLLSECGCQLVDWRMQASGGDSGSGHNGSSAGQGEEAHSSCRSLHPAALCSLCTHVHGPAPRQDPGCLSQGSCRIQGFYCEHQIFAGLTPCIAFCSARKAV